MMRWLLLLLAAGGAGALALLGKSRKASASEQLPPDGNVPVPTAVPQADFPRQTGRVTLKTTKYWPFAAQEHERAMEGGVHGAASWRGQKAIDPGTGRRPDLYPLEAVIAGKAPYVSLSGDPAVWPFGQRLEIDAWPGVVFRVTDTGGSFKGKNKQYKIDGAEPIDICVLNKNTKVPTTTGARIVPGDNWEGGAAVAVANLRGQTVVVGDLTDRPPHVPTDAVAWDETGWWTADRFIPLVEIAQTAYSDYDREALARAVESAAPKGSVEEKQAVAWACRNRAAKVGTSVHALLAPQGVYGPRGDGGRDFLSTDRDPEDTSSQVARAVLALGSAYDPTGGATDFWNPAQQRRAKVLGDAQVLMGGDAVVMGEDEVRAVLQSHGLRVLGSVGDIELLG